MSTERLSHKFGPYEYPIPVWKTPGALQRARETAKNEAWRDIDRKIDRRAAEAHAEIKAMVKSRRRSIGQRFRYLRARKDKLFRPLTPLMTSIYLFNYLKRNPLARSMYGIR